MRCETKCGLLVAGLASMGCVGFAAADTHVFPGPFELEGAESVNLRFDSTTTSLGSITISFDYDEPIPDSSWASDVQIVLTDGNVTVTIGGYSNAGAADVSWPFDGSGSSAPGFYSGSFLLPQGSIPMGYDASQTQWTMLFTNDWTDDPNPNEYANITIEFGSNQGCCIDNVCTAMDASDCLAAGGVVLETGTCTPAFACNDVWEDAMQVFGGETILASNVVAEDQGEGAGCGLAGPTVWFFYTAPCDTLIEVNTCGEGTLADTVLNFYDGNPFDGGVSIACNDDTAVCEIGVRSAIQDFAVLKGETIYIRVHGYEGTRGTFSLSVLEDPVCDAPSCPGDANGDGEVNVLDLLAVISSWGNICDPGEDCPGDANGDGVVNVDDLLEVISNWGASCP